MGKYIILNMSSERIASESKIIKREDYTKLLSAKEVLINAQLQGDVILCKAREDGEEIKNNARLTGLDVGKTEAAEIILTTKQEAHNYLVNFEKIIVELVVTTVEKMLGSIPNGELVKKMAITALSKLSVCNRVVVRVDPNYISDIKKILNKERDNEPELNIDFISFEADESLRGKTGCILESDIGNVEALLVDQVKQIRDRLYQNFSLSHQKIR